MKKTKENKPGAATPMAGSIPAGGAAVPSSGVVLYLYMGGTVATEQQVQVAGRSFTRRTKPVARMWKKLAAPTATSHAQVAQVLARYPVPPLR